MAGPFGEMSRRIHYVFQRFDKEGGEGCGDGYLDLLELRKLFKVMGPKHLGAEEINGYCASLDTGGDGKVSVDEFSEWVCSSGEPVAQEVKKAIVKATNDDIERRKQLDEVLPERIKEVFTKFDKSGDGFLDMGELKQVMKVMAPKTLTPDNIERFCDDVDRGKDGKVSSTEFTEWVLGGGEVSSQFARAIEKAASETRAKRIKEVFRTYDKSNDGFLDMRELQKVLKTLDPSRTPSEITSLCNDIDNSKDGKTFYQEFVDWINGTSQAAREFAKALFYSTGDARTARISKTFKAMDKTGDGSLDVAELDRSLRSLGNFAPEEVLRICKDLDSSGDGQVTHKEFSSWIRSGQGTKEIIKAKAILAPSDLDGMEAVFYNFCAPGMSDMDNKSFLKLCADCGIMDSKFNENAVDLIFSNSRVKIKGQRNIDFDHFEIALELVAHGTGEDLDELRERVLSVYRPKEVRHVSTASLPFQKGTRAGTAGSTMSGAKPRTPRSPRAAAALNSSKRFYLLPGVKFLPPVKVREGVDNSELWKLFPMTSAASKSLRRTYGDSSPSR
eukprot:TRINITY_DN30020_c0_g1_i1.p1 TRINITY_DN30020_c0_g1~~TRINITY_DN30020_c0_g1_i1.p1  ORF type:complete len:578 (-),score=137.50 TRINITY_DN30020_c0_g1_i1:41-1714(-)